MKLIEFTKVADMLGKEHKIKICEGNSWAANLKSREVFYRKEDIYKLPEEHILGLLLHEVAHIHYTGDVTMPKDNPELTHTCLNMIEDISIEKIISNDYPNAGEILESTKEEVLDKLVEMLPKLVHVSIFERSLLYAAALFEDRGYTYETEDYEKLGKKISKIMLKNKQLILTRKHTRDLMPIVDEIIKLMIKEAGQPTQDQKNEMNRSLIEGKANSIQVDGEIKGKLIKELKAGNGWELGPNMSHQVVYVDEIADQAQLIGKQLRTVLKRNNSMEFGGRYRTGKLLAKRIVKIKVLKDRNPFARRVIKSNQSYAFAIASDVSGSMFNNRAKVDAGSYALSSLHMVGEALRYAAVPHSLTIFGMNANTVAPMGKKQIPFSVLSAEKAFYKANQGGTDIAAAINACHTQLSNVRAERKIMIVLTDGSSDMEDMKTAHTKAVKDGIECLGITLGDEWMGRTMDNVFGKKNVRIENTKDNKLIGKTFIDILKKSITASK